MEFCLLLITSLVAVTSGQYCLPNDRCWPSRQDIDTFSDTLAGSVHFKSEPDYNTYVRTKNGRVGKHPAFLVLASTTEDVQKSMRFARRSKLRVSIQSSGHDYIGRSTCDDCMQINLGAMKGINVDLKNQDGVVTVQSGCSWKEIYEEVDTHGRVILGGSAHTVSPGGYTLGGGHSPISRSLGLAVDNVLEFEMVDVDGNLVKSTANGTDITYENGTTATSSDADLFWALRGGGGGTFGVVTKFTFKLHQPPSQVVKFYCGYAMYFHGHNIGFDMLTEFRKLLKDLPPEWGGYVILLGSAIDSTLFGPMLFVMNHYGAMTNEAKTYLEPLYSRCPNHTFTEYDTFYKYEETIIDEEFTWLYTFNTFMSADDLTEEWMDFAASEMTSAPSYGAFFGCTGVLIGGKVKDVPTQATAVHPAFRSSDVSMTCYLAWSEKAPSFSKEFNVRKAAELGRKLQTFGNGVYVNEPGADLRNWQSDFWGSNYNRLREIKEKWDPDNFLTCRYCVGYIAIVSSSGSQTACLAAIILSLVVALLRI
ncbi:hypothetical protein ScPMuIL_013301 [Solemya velum]